MAEGSPTVVGLVSPGQMGSSVGAAARSAGVRVLVALEGRSPASRRRAAQDGLEDAGSLGSLVASCGVLLSVCPPPDAARVASQVLEAGFRGVYVDANAISPGAARAIAGLVEAGSARFVDGGLVGPPARAAGTTRLYLSGAAAAEVGRLFSGSMLEAVVIGAEPGAASALKMAYASYSKGTAALLAAAHAVARAHAVDGDLLAEWDRSMPGLGARLEATAANVAPKAWRFVGEMHEIARTFEEAGLPGGFHAAAADVYERLAHFKGADDPPDAAAVAAALLDRRRT